LTFAYTALHCGTLFFIPLILSGSSIGSIKMIGSISISGSISIRGCRILECIRSGQLLGLGPWVPPVNKSGRGRMMDPWRARVERGTRTKS
jgi:hypothetical protein